MRFIADENIPGVLVDARQADGHDVFWVRMEKPGSSDEHILQWAQKEHRILLTFDKDFGELAFRYGLPASSGIILFRIRAPVAMGDATQVARVLSARHDWAGHFSVIEPRRVRMTTLPSSPQRKV